MTDSNIPRVDNVILLQEQEASTSEAQETPATPKALETPETSENPENPETPEVTPAIEKPEHEMGDRWQEALTSITGECSVENFSDLGITLKKQVVSRLDKFKKEVDKELEKEEKKLKRQAISSRYGLLNAPFRALGFNEGYFFFMPESTMQIVSLTAESILSKSIIQLADLDWWRDSYPKIKENGEPAIEPEWLSAGNDLMLMCKHKGIYQPSTIRGRGYWRDDEAIIHNKGDKLININESIEVSLVDNSLKNIYQRTGNDSRSFKPLTGDQIDAFINTVHKMPWADKNTQPPLYMGWIAIAPFIALLNWRPHIWITAPKSSGKTDTACRGLGVCINEPSRLHFKGSTTEAGIRQSLGNNAQVTIVDECEPNDQKDHNRIIRIIDFARNQSAEDDAIVAKGSASGNAVSFNGHSCMAFASINHALEHEADISRWSILAMKALPVTEKSIQDFNDIADWFEQAKKDNFGKALEVFLSKPNRLNILLTNIETASARVGKQLKNSRQGKQLGAMMGGYLTLISDRLANENEIDALLKQIDVGSTVAAEIDDTDNGWIRCWCSIASLNLQFQDYNSKITVGEGLSLLSSNNEAELLSLSGQDQIELKGDEKYNESQQRLINKAKKSIEKALSKFGIRYQYKKPEEDDIPKYYIEGTSQGIYLSRSCVNLKKALKGTPFEGWDTYSKREGKPTEIPMKINAGESKRADFIGIESLSL